jgi:flagellar biogenesis protein FliO
MPPVVESSENASSVHTHLSSLALVSEPIARLPYRTCWRAKGPRQGGRIKKCFHLWLFLFFLLVCNSNKAIQAQNLNAIPSVGQGTNGFPDPAIVRTQPRAVGTPSFAAPAQVPSNQWPDSNTNASSTEVKQANFQRQASYSLPFRPDEKNSSESRLKKPSSGWSSTVSMFVSLLIVIGLFLFVARIFRGLSPTPQRFLPKEVVQVIGRSPLAPRQQMFLVRFGGKLLLVSQQLGQTTTLSEIENPDEVAHLLGLCEQQSSNSISNSFRDVLQQITLGSTKKDAKTSVRSPRRSTSQYENQG